MIKTSYSWFSFSSILRWSALSIALLSSSRLAQGCYLKPGEPDGSLDVSGLSVMERIGYAQQLHQSLDLATLQYGNPPAGQARQGQTSELPGPE
jgi:hypothetical protein